MNFNRYLFKLKTIPFQPVPLISMLLRNLTISGRDAAPDLRRQVRCRGGGGCPLRPAAAVPRERPVLTQRSPWNRVSRRGLEFTVKLCSWSLDLVEITEGGGEGGCGADAGEVVLMRGPGVGRG